MIRVAHLVSHPIHYFIPIYKELHKIKDISFTVIYYTLKTTGKLHKNDYSRDINFNVSYFEGYHWVSFPKSNLLEIPNFFYNSPRIDILAHLWKEKYDIIWIHGYYLVMNWFAVLLQSFNKRISFLRTEDVLFHKRKNWKKIIKYFPLRFLLSQTYGLYIGEANKKYLEYYGIPKTRLYPAIYCADNQYFQTQYEKYFPYKDNIRKDLGIVNPYPIILFCGRLVEMKCPLLLLEAFQIVATQLPCNLLVVGDGPLRNVMEEKITRDKIKNVYFTGFLNQSEISKAYSASDLFVLPSTHDTWGLVINEAMNFGLPVIASDLVGCVGDLVKDGENGFVFPANNVHKLADCIKTLINDESMRKKMGQKSKEIIESYSVKRCVDQLVYAFKSVMYLPKNNHSCSDPINE